MNFIPDWFNVNVLRALCAVSIMLMLMPSFAQANLLVRISEVPGEQLQFDLRSLSAEPVCAGSNGHVFNPALAMTKVSETTFLKSLNSEAVEGEHYLKAARMGSGVYLYLPYFFPARVCKDVVFEISAQHILWQGEWHAERLRLSLDEVRGKAIFLTNELKPTRQAGRYFDASIPAATLQRLQAAFEKINSYYERVLKVRPQQGIGVVAAIARNQAAYSGYGGDANNIIRMSFDNPNPTQLENVDAFMPLTFAHELAHKLQTDKLHAYAPARYIVEGQAEFFKVLVMFNSGLLDDYASRQVLRKAMAACTAMADGRSVSDKLAQGTYAFREPYDCGLAYYFVAYFSSGINTLDFVEALGKAMRGEEDYSRHKNTLCLLFEADCQNQRLLGMKGAKPDYLPQIQWLEDELTSQPLPLLR